MDRGFVDNELERIWKRQSRPDLTFPGRTERNQRTSFRIAEVPAEISTDHLPNTSP
jgi:hypothetical protein